MKFRLFIGGMANCNKLSAIDMLYTDETDFERPPRFPKILYCLGVPLIWFWGETYSEEEPHLPPALDPEYFTLIYDYDMEELNGILSRIKHGL